MGIKTNLRSSNWFAKVGTEDNHVIVAGCQIHYTVRSEARPKLGKVHEFSIENGEIKDYIKPHQSYYIAE